MYIDFSAQILTITETLTSTTDCEYNYDFL